MQRRRFCLHGTRGRAPAISRVEMTGARFFYPRFAEKARFSFPCICSIINKINRKGVTAVAALSLASPDELYEKFCATPQEPQRLAIALRGFFDANTTPAQREAYGAYLQKRIRPAAAALMEDEDVDKLEILERQGWLADGQLDGLIQLARARSRTASLVWLLRLKAERGQYHDRDFSL